MTGFPDDARDRPETPGGPDPHGPDAHGPDPHGPDPHGLDAHGPGAHGPDPHRPGTHALGPHGLDQDGDELPERLLHRPGEYLPPPPGAFERIRRRAARRRRVRALAGGAVVAAMVTGSVLLAGALGRNGADQIVAPPASSSTPRPAPTTTTTTAPASDPPTSAPTTHPLPTGTVHPSPTARATPGPPDARTPTSPGSTPLCPARGLTAVLADGEAAAGNVYRYLVLTNRGDTVCHLAGYAGVSLLDAGGRQIGVPATRAQTPYGRVVLAPGDSASGTVHTLNRQGSCLPASARLRIYPPGSREALMVEGAVTVCGGTFEITPLAPGRTGNPLS